MKILLTGGTGTLGTSLRQELASHEIIAPRRHELNVANLDQVMKFKADFIIHLASETDHEFCEMNPAQAYLVNSIGTMNMTRLAMSLDIPILYVSTASVFDGKKGLPYIEIDKPNPINHYNASKYYGEIFVSNWEKNYIVRTGWLFGGGRNLDKKFVSKMMNKISRGDKEILVCDDCIGSPTYSDDLAKAILMIIKGLSYGTYHVVNSGLPASRYDVAVEMVKKFPDVKIKPCKIDDLKSEFPCKRTNYEALKSNFNLPDWRVSLGHYIENNY